MSDVYLDISLAINIEGFRASRCIFNVYRGALSPVSLWCCIADRFKSFIIVAIVLKADQQETFPLYSQPQ